MECLMFSLYCFGVATLALPCFGAAWLPMYMHMSCAELCTELCAELLSHADAGPGHAHWAISGLPSGDKKIACVSQ
eukprot:4848500-Heterocapsa_arctica.AAC.1